MTAPRLCTRVGLAVLCGLMAAAAARAGIPVFLDTHAALEARVTDLLARLNIDEKEALMAGGSPFGTMPIRRLGILPLHFSDGPNGVTSIEGRPTTVFPTGAALAATWNPAVVRGAGEAIGREARALGVQVLLGPDINIQRVPLAGRNFEDYSEDPLLSGRMGIAMVQGIQSQGVGASVKHFVGNEQELERLHSDSQIDERTLHEIYLRPFEMVVQQAHPWSVMVSYNQLNGTYMSENRALVAGVLEGEWGFDGLVMSDWGAVHSTVAAARSGLSLEMPGPAKFFNKELTQAVRAGEVEPRLVEEAARRMVRLVLRSGVLDGRGPVGGDLLSPRNHKAALAAAQESVVLLKNGQGLLPLDGSHGTLAVIGPNADVPLYEGGGSARAAPELGETSQTPLTALRQLAPDAHLVYARGADNDEVPPPIDARLLVPAVARPGRAEHGLSYRYYAGERVAGAPVRQGVETDFGKLRFAAGMEQVSARWEGFLEAPETGTYEFSLGGTGEATLSLDGRELIGPAQGEEQPPVIDFSEPWKLSRVELTAGRRYALKVEYVSTPGGMHALHLGLRRPPPSLEEAVAAARSADAAIVFVGSSRGTETEGRDRSSLALAGRQNELVEAVLAANPHTVVVLQSGSPYELPWADKAPAIVQGWLNGEQGPLALAQVLLGQVSPSGRLPFTMPRQLADNPTQAYYPAEKVAAYGEGVLVGYRWYDRQEAAPLFPFGHGLSYTTFDYSHLHAPARMTAGTPFEVSLQVRNSGTREAREVVQLYVGDGAKRAVVRPVKELRGFEKIALAAGQTRTVRFTLTPRDLAYYDAGQHKWVSPQGTYHLFIGSSSRDIRLSQDFQWTIPKD